MNLNYQNPNSPPNPRPQCRAVRRSLSAFSIQHSAFSISPAFSIVEVLFAVMILGIGFIMVAAIFPVGIQQGRDAIDDTTGRTIARDAANRAAAAFHSIGDADRATVGDANLKALDLLSKTPKLHYQPIDPADPTLFTLPTWTITNGANPPGTIGGGGMNLYQLTGGDWEYPAQPQYLSQLFFRTTFNWTARTGMLSILAIAMRDGRATPGIPLAFPYVRECQILTDGKDNIYSDLYVQGVNASAGMTDADIAAFLGTNGAIVTVSGGITRLQDSPSLKGATPPAGKTWALDGVNAWMFSSDIPVIGSYTLTTSLP